MRNTIFGMAIWDRKVSIIITSSAMFLFALMYASMHHAFAGDMVALADSFPPELTAVFGDILAASTPAGFLNVELYSLFLPFTVAITGIAFASKAIGGEEDSGTLELLLASPISRSKIIIEKLAAIKFTLLTISFMAWLGVAVGKTLFIFDVNLLHVALASLSVFLLSMLYAVVALAGQSVTGKRSVGVGVGTGLLILTYFIDIISKLIDNLENLKYFSPFYYMDMPRVINGNGQLKNFAILLAASVVFYIVAHVAFINRDTGV
jgi:ABC-2 type transport system permease protein